MVESACSMRETITARVLPGVNAMPSVVTLIAR
jgi:hypothetical protein